MDCRRFLKNHCAFVDDTLPGLEMAAMRRHLNECARCARHDIAVRRGIMIVRNLPLIEPSPDFNERLQARLRKIEALPVDSQWSRTARLAGFAGVPFAMGGFTAVAASLLLVIAAAVFATRGEESHLALPPVLAKAPPSASHVTSAAVAASVSAGAALWPAILIADQAPMDFAATEFRLASWRR